MRRLIRGLGKATADGSTYAPRGVLAGSSDRRVMLFHRDFRRFHGGHLKVWDYFTHVLSSSSFVPLITFSAGSVWDETNPWHNTDLERCDRPAEPDALFLAGSDWNMVPRAVRDSEARPIFNLIQHVRHADVGSERAGFLRHRAIRICVGPEVAEAIEGTGLARGPVITIPNGIDTAGLAQRGTSAQTDVLIVANKQPELGRLAHATLASAAPVVRVIDETIARERFLDELAGARVTVFFPNPREGFYLPALEGMAVGTLVVCPDCIGNRSFCVPARTAFRPDYDLDDIVTAARSALALADGERNSIVEAAAAMAAEHDLQHERRRFVEVLERVDDLWTR